MPKVNISLRETDIQSYKALAKMEREPLARLKAIIEGGCIPLHIARKEDHDPEILVHPMLDSDCKHRRLSLPKKVIDRAREIADEENKKLAQSGVSGTWIDGVKLAVADVGTFEFRKAQSVDIRVRRMMWSEIIAMKSYSFKEIAALHSFKLDTNTHVLAMDGGHEVVLVGQRGRKPGEPRMGSEALLAPVGNRVQWTLATNGTIDGDMLECDYERSRIWVENSLKEFKEELGVEGGSFNVRYLGLIVDTRMFVGAIGILGAIETRLSPYEIDEARKRARHGVEVPVLDIVPMEKEAIAAYLRVNRDSMVPQLVSGLAILGYSRWGTEFLELADKH